MRRLSLPLLALAMLVVLTVAACVRTSPIPVAAPSRSDQPAVNQPLPARTVTADAPSIAPPAWPALDHEPELAVMVQRGTSLRLRLLLPHRLPGGGELPAGSIDIAVAGTGFRVAGHVLPGPLAELTAVGTGNTFAIDSITCSGRLRLARAGGTVEAIEVVGMETWLAGVLPAEMHPRWPVEALGAQAIVARSYAAARWQARAGMAWHLLRGTADVAYDGIGTPSPEVSTALDNTRGLLLVSGGQAILARFHACSGGRTEDSAALWPTATLLDGRTPLGRFMHAVDDPASVEGARGLNWTRTHQQWRAAITLTDLSERLSAWSKADKRRPAISQVLSIAIAGNTPSGRIAQVAVTHRAAGGERRDTIEANEFRLAVGANRLRSLWWEKSVMASANGGQWVVEGRGFGHGVGLPQVSAWSLARDGVQAADIVHRYYPDATLARMWR
jgi:SpoIID/LytB domain protein